MLSYFVLHVWINDNDDENARSAHQYYTLYFLLQIYFICHIITAAFTAFKLESISVNRIDVSTLIEFLEI